MSAHFVVVELDNADSFSIVYLWVMSGDVVHRDIRVAASSIEVKQHTSEHWSVSMYLSNIRQSI